MSDSTAIERALPFLKLENFWPKVEKRGPAECWLWKAAQFPKGHGAFAAYDAATGRRFMVRAHRLVFFLATVQQPEAVMHKCDVPQCCNPDHLEAGTVLLNNLDRDKKGRVRHGERHADAKLSAADVSSIRAMVGTVTQAAIAARFGVSPSQVSMILSGKRRARG